MLNDMKNGLFDDDKESAAPESEARSATWSEGGSMEQKNINSNNKWRPRAILLGQFIAMLSATSNAASFTLVNHFGFQAPFFLLFLLYMLLSLHLFRRRRHNDDDDDDDDDYSSHFGEKTPMLSSLTKQDENDSLSRMISSSTTKLRRKLRLPCCCRVMKELKCPLYMYFGISFLDVLPNFLVLLALSYTSLTSGTLLLGSLTVPSTMFFSSRRRLLSRYFSHKHYVGAGLCVVGGMLAVGLDCSSFKNPSFSSTPGAPPTSTASTATSLHFADSTTEFFFALNVGDLLMCTAALLYGLGDTVAEYFVKHLDRDEYLGMLGIFGMLQTSILFPLLEHDALTSAWAKITMMPQPAPVLLHPPDGELHVIAQSNGPLSDSSTETKWFMLVTLIWFVACQYLYYVMEVRFLATSDATLLNLSMQTTNLWAILFSMVVFANPAQQLLLRHVLPPPLFYVALVLVVSGVAFYEMDGTKTNTTQHQEQHSQDKLEKLHCPRHCNIGQNDDDDADGDDDGDEEGDDDDSEGKVLFPETRRHNDYQSCRI
jgi:drug/metabolite transporter (DMT)-like permease